MIRESLQSWGSPSPSSISYAMASWSPSQSWTTDATCSHTTDLGVGDSKSRLLALMDAMEDSCACEWGGAGGMNTTDLWWTLFSPSISTDARWRAFQLETPARLHTALSQSFRDKVYPICVEFLRRLQEGESEE